ncbi:MAG: PPOX class F420-dependent oxidoreductase [Actinomycetota bacterium]
MELSEALSWAAQRSNAVLITIRRDGRAQSSDIAYTVDDGDFLISLTADRAKTKNMQRDNRVVLHITEPSSWSYLSFDGTVVLTEPATAPDDAVADALVAYYEQVAGKPHPDWDEYRAAMVAEGRLVARVTPGSVVGQTH